MTGPKKKKLFPQEMLNQMKTRNGRYLTELFQTLSAAVQTSLLGKTTITSPVLIQRTCGATTNQNSTHFTNPGYPNPVSDSSDTMCTITLLRSHKVPICQVRLDFLDFALANPTEGDCLDDKLVIQENNINAPVPSICGRNTGQHMYIDVDNSLAQLHCLCLRRVWDVELGISELLILSVEILPEVINSDLLERLEHRVLKWCSETYLQSNFRTLSKLSFVLGSL
ncbi:hypothetical protein CEXT_109811, partial [Caerostris extrusa]